MSAVDEPVQRRLRICVEEEDGTLSEASIELEIRFARRRSLSLRLRDRTHLEIKAPIGTPLSFIEDFLQQKKGWLERRWLAQGEAGGGEAPDETELAMLRRLTLERAEAFLAAYDGPKPQRISVRRQKSRWGSYSASGTLSLNLNAALLDERLFEYLMIHELAHIEEMNHSPAFWAKVEARIPDYKARRKALKAIPFKV